MNLLVIGLNHRTAPLAVRERFALSAIELPHALRTLRGGAAVDEAVIISTCNRVECYVACADAAVGRQRIIDVLTFHSRLDPAAFQSNLYFRHDEAAVRHLFRVTAGLDSMVLGESEIAAQVKHAYLTAQAGGATGPFLHRLFQKALHAAKLIRSQTRLAEGSASIGSVVVRLARQLFGSRLSDCQVLLWGAGKAAEVTARHLLKEGVGQLWVVNRTQTKAQELATLCRGGWLSWEQALKHLAHVDIAIVCTQAPHYVVDRADLEMVMPPRGDRPLFLVDLAVPRNIEPALAQHPEVHLYNIDDLQAIAQGARAQREQERERCETLIQEQVSHFARRWTLRSHKEAVTCQLVAV